VAEKAKAAGKDETLDNAISTAVREQAAKKAITFVKP
jgi:hypothetical protein